MAAVVKSITLFPFNVGFGDCSLLRFSYDDSSTKHVLIDFGSMAGPDKKTRPNNYMVKVAKQIKQLCGSDLDVLFVTHRHKDHISGFRTNARGTGPGDVIKSCKPKMIVQPWTEHPRADRNAKFSPDQSSAELRYAKSLLSMSEFSESVLAFSGSLAAQRLFNDSERKVLGFLGENNIKNKNAVENLMAMTKNRKYVAFGDNIEGLDKLLPGVSIDILGPPTLRQWNYISDQNPRNEDEYWHLSAQALNQSIIGEKMSRSEGSSLFKKKYTMNPLPSWAKWGANRLAKMHRDNLLSIVRRLDSQMNNTSLILLFTVNNKSLLFPGDAQWENWSYALTNKDVKDDVLEKLTRVDLYKVGHHGSLNATPKSLWKLFENKGDKDKQDRLISILSTKSGLHGHSEETAVPRSTLVKDLNAESTLVDTRKQGLKKSSTVFHSAPITIEIAD